MERLTRSFSTSTVDINKAWRRKVYDGKVDGSPDRRKEMKTVKFGESRHGRLWKLKKLFHLKGSSDEHAVDEVAEEAEKSKLKPQHQSKIADSRDKFESYPVWVGRELNAADVAHGNTILGCGTPPPPSWAYSCMAMAGDAHSLLNCFVFSMEYYRRRRRRLV
ncbi:hypothetical protein LXL04_024491 [Taraxacum kok-saghyz]